MTFATVIVPAADVAAAREDLPGHFTAAFSPTGAPPATHYVSSGHFLPAELDFIANKALWAHSIRFIGVAKALEDAGVLPIQEEPLSPA